MPLNRHKCPSEAFGLKIGTKGLFCRQNALRGIYDDF
jgi:hypothetical protein